MTQLFINIKELVQVRDAAIKKVSGIEMKKLPTIKNAFLLVKDELIFDFGTMDKIPDLSVDEIIDCSGKIILPSWCDSHSHLVFAGNREHEFVDRIKGRSYQEIADNGGGIINSAINIKTNRNQKLILGSLNSYIDLGYAKDYMILVYELIRLHKPDDYIISSGSKIKIGTLVKIVFDYLKIDYKKLTF